MPALTAQYAKEHCWKSTLAVLAERRYELKASDETTGKIETGRRYFEVNAVMTSSSARSTSVATAQLQQSDKLWIEVSGDDKQCAVTYIKARLWNGEEELADVQHEGGDWYLKNVVQPLNRDITETLAAAK